MKIAREFVTSAIIGGVFVVVPIYLATLLLFKGMQSVSKLVRPIAALLPDWLPAEGFFSLIVLLLSVSLSAQPCVLERGGRFKSAWRSCSSSGYPGTASYAA